MDDACNHKPLAAPAAEPVRAQLDRILGSAEFHATDRLRAMLRFVVEQQLEGHGQRLHGYSIAVEVFGRSTDFDATHDPVVRVEARRLRAALERYYLTAGSSDPVLIEIPKGGYVPVFSARTAHSDRSRPGGFDVGRRPRLAVMPLEVMPTDDHQQAFASGLTEELVTELTRFQDLAVVSCQPLPAAAANLGRPEDLARQLEARFLLCGAVRRDPDSIKVSARLSDVREDRQIWAESFTRPAAASELISTQEQIAEAVVGSIAGAFGIISRHLSSESRKKRPAELATYEAMLRYYSHQMDPRPESARACFTALQAAAEREPDYGAAWSALATLFAQMHTFDVPGFDHPLETALDFARRGVQLDPGSQLAHMVHAYSCHLAGDSRSFLEEARNTLRLNPCSPYPVGAIGYFHAMRGEFSDGLPLIDRAIASTPNHPNWFHSAYVLEHLHEGDDEAALAATTLHQPFLEYWDDVATAAILGRMGRRAQAAPHLARLGQAKPDFAQRARELIERSLKSPTLVDLLLDGLRSAGLRTAG